MSQSKAYFLIFSLLLGSSVLSPLGYSQEVDASQNPEILAQKLYEGYRDISKWEQEIEGLKLGLKYERDAHNNGQLLPYLVLPEDGILATGLLGGATAGYAYWTYHLLRSGDKLTAFFALVSTLILAGDTYEVTLGKDKKGIFVRLDTEEADRLKTAIAQAKKEIKLIKERLGHIHQELSQDARYLEAFEKLKVENLSKDATLEDRGRNQNYLDEINQYEAQENDLFRHSQKRAPYPRQVKP